MEVDTKATVTLAVVVATAAAVDLVVGKVHAAVEVAAAVAVAPVETGVLPDVNKSDPS